MELEAGVESRINNGEIIMLNRLKIVSLLKACTK